jgi:DNA helicase-2/ATP-dependent DNA helicase PcrA
MSSVTITSEQEAVICHPLGRHARVLAVAGSGKTTTMAYRIKYLIEEQNVAPSSIRVLMFNKLARVQFQERLAEIGIPRKFHPPVDTFHSFSYRLIRQMMDARVIPASVEFWTDGRGERIWLYTNIAITNLEREGIVPAGHVDPEEAVQAISLWKGSLIPPSRAGYRGDLYLPLVYEEYERLRIRKGAITFDDFVVMAVGILEYEQSVRADWCNRVAHIIVDEYQDVNFGQQRLIELLAGERGDVMVVGDDDQTIYEWRGARPHYMIREFQTAFSNKPHTDYTLSRSFRFGPVIAQCAFNSISFNTTRVPKPLVAHRADKQAEVHILEGSDANRELADQIITLVKEQGVPPSEIRVLVRTYAQLAGLEAECLDRGIPYQVVGRNPFFERRENAVLLEYVRLAMALDSPVTTQTERWLLSIANTPSRKLGRKDLSQAMRSARFHGATTREALTRLADDPASSLCLPQQQRVTELVTLLDQIRQRVTGEPDLLAGTLLGWLVDTLNYLDHFTEYYGDGWESFDRKRAVINFVDYARGTGLPPVEFLNHIASLDTTRGAPEAQQIVMTSVFREKGCEYDFVMIPQCEEGYMPCLRQTGNLVFDKAGLVEEPEPSEAIENERRLFYVGLTRAKKAVFIGTVASTGDGALSHLPSRFLDEIQLEATTNVMESLQRLASGVDGAREELLAAVKQFGGVRKITKNLVAEYLKDIGDDALLSEVSRIAASRPETPFGYRLPLTPPTIPGAVQPPPPPALHKVWADVAF